LAKRLSIGRSKQRSNAHSEYGAYKDIDAWVERIRNGWRDYPQMIANGKALIAEMQTMHETKGR
jgi:hypothetical protein